MKDKEIWFQFLLSLLKQLFRNGLDVSALDCTTKCCNSNSGLFHGLWVMMVIVYFIKVLVHSTSLMILLLLLLFYY